MRQPRHRYTWKQYVALESASNVKHEFFDGEIFAMAGGTPEHAALGLAIGSELRGQLEGKPCLVYSSDLRVRVLPSGLSTYPDVTVVCGPLQVDPEDRNTVTNPTVVVEVLSDSTESYDRGEKRDHYFQLASLREYVLVSHREQLVEVFWRGDDGHWSRSEARAGAMAQVPSLGARLSVARVYAGVTLAG